jgi:ComF family protein
MSRVLAQLANGMVAVIFPPVCAHCRGVVESGGTYRHLCVRCALQLEFVHEPHCPTCGHPYYGELTEETHRMCPRCAGLSPAFREGRTAVLFKGPARALVIELKYHRGLHVLADMEEIFRRSPHILDYVRGAVLVPVPLHSRKQRERSYNQVMLLAERLARVAEGGTRIEVLLHRTADTATQTAFDRQTRQGNLKNAFALVRGAALNPDLHYILIDDVFTTGSTLNSCALVLRRAGCLNLDVVTFGHG